jgi:TusA-related sulfurtransferase
MSESIKVDARGLSCPEPVMLAKRAMRQEGAISIEVLVDSGASRDNVERVAAMAGWTVRVAEPADGLFRLDLAK